MINSRRSFSWPRTCVISVTYGSRQSFMSRVVKGVSRLDARCRITDIIIVDNGSGWEPLDLRRECEQLGIRLRLVRNNANLGSAVGFGLGLQYAYDSTECDCFWLLDDDNCPRQDAFSNLLMAWAYLGSDPDKVLLSHRPIWAGERRLLEGHSAGNRVNAFLGFHIAEKLGQLLMQTKRNNPIETRTGNCNGCHPKCPIVQVSEAHYGGLFFHRQWVSRVGLPNGELYLYEDDHEYTRRIVANGGRIFLCGNSVIEDLDLSWHQDTLRNPVFNPDSNESNVYYLVRNRVFLELRYCVSSRMIYIMNAMLNGLWNALSCLLAGDRPRDVFRRVAVIITAILHGWRGKLGKVAGFR